MRAIACSALVFAMLSGACTGLSAQAVLTHAIVIDGSGADPRRDVTIVIENGRISRMGTGIPIPADAAAVDLTGKFVVPGIINAHGHVGPAPRDPQLRRYALYGV